VLGNRCPVNKLTAKDREDHLSRELLANADLAASREQKLHREIQVKPTFLPLGVEPAICIIPSFR
jgi:hypothetical protein